MLIDQNEINELPPDKVAILCTGSQGEPLAALARLSTGNFRGVEVLPKDTVILAAGPIPGNERSVTSIVDNFYAIGAKVIYGSQEVHPACAKDEVLLNPYIPRIRSEYN